MLGFFRHFVALNSRLNEKISPARRKKGKVTNMNGYWISTCKRPDDTHFYLFKKDFLLDFEAENFEIKICADTRYRLYINGIHVCEGPCQGGEDVTYYEKLNAAKYLKAGLNTIEVKVLHVANGEFISVYRRERPALWFCGTVSGKDGALSVISDKSWSCDMVDSVAFHACPGLHSSIPPFEDVKENFVLSREEIREMYEPHPESSCINLFGLGEPYMLKERPIPLLHPEAAKEMKEIKRYSSDGKTVIEFDAGEYVTAYVDFLYSSDKGNRINVIYAECYTSFDDNGNACKTLRDNTDGVLVGAWDTLCANGEKQNYSPFWYRSFRYIKVETEGEFLDFKVYASRFVYPFAGCAESGGVGSFESSDEIFNRMWKVSLNTVDCSSHEMFVDCPYYEQQQYAMDGGLEALFAFRMTNNPALQKKIIVDMAQSQLPDGMIQANYPSVGCQVIPSFSLYWVMMLREYLRYTGDVGFVKSMSGIADRVLQGFDDLIGEDGLIGPTHYWPFVDWVPSWPVGVPNGGRDKPITVYSMIYAAALDMQSEVCLACGRTGLAKEYGERKERMLAAVNNLCFDRNRGMYTDVLGISEFSEHTALWAVLSGAVSGYEAGELIDRVFAVSGVSKCTFSMNYYMFRALEKAGRYEKYSDRVFEGWRHMLDLHCTTWCENPDSPRSECHGWSSAPIYEFSAMMLGVFPEKDGFLKVRIKPLYMGVESAGGRVPMPGGYIDVSRVYKNGKFELNVASSKKIDVQIILPDESRKEYKQTDKISISSTC